MTKRIRGWCSPLPSRCRAAHYVDPADNTRALCGSPIRTLAGTKKHPVELCDHCQTAVRLKR